MLQVIRSYLYNMLVALLLTLVTLINVVPRLLILRVFVPIFFVFHLNKDFAYVCSKIHQPPRLFRTPRLLGT